jgi:type IV pilus assembly protein PilA
MRKFIQNKLKEQKGLTLIELLAVIVILAIIAAIAIPAIGNIINNSRVGAIKSDFQNAIAAAELYLLDNPNDNSVTLLNLQGKDDSATPKNIEIYLEDEGSLDSTFVYTVDTKKIVGKGTVGSISVQATGATKEEISSLANNSPAITTGSIILDR